MNINTYNRTNYENISDWTIGENKPNSNPIKPNFFKCQNERKIGCVHISKKYNVLNRKVLDSQTYFVVKNGLY